MIHYCYNAAVEVLVVMVVVVVVVVVPVPVPVPVPVSMLAPVLLAFVGIAVDNREPCAVVTAEVELSTSFAAEMGHSVIAAVVAVVAVVAEEYGCRLFQTVGSGWFGRSCNMNCVQTTFGVYYI